MIWVLRRIRYPPGGVLERRLAVRCRDNRRGYAAAKEPFSGAVIRRAGGWAQAHGQAWAAPPEPDAGTVSGNDVADPLGRASLRVEGGCPLGQLPELAAELLELPDAHLQVGGVAV
jgi:hypothetical protein